MAMHDGTNNLMRTAIRPATRTTSITATCQFRLICIS